MVVRFEAGVPVPIDGESLPLYQLVERMTEAAGVYGYGRLDMVENRRVGIKSRGLTRSWFARAHHRAR